MARRKREEVIVEQFTMLRENVPGQAVVLGQRLAQMAAEGPKRKDQGK